VLASIWVATASTVTVEEIAVGVVAALPCAYAAAVGRRAAEGCWRIRPGWAGWFLSTPATVVADTARVLRRCLFPRPCQELGRTRWIEARPVGLGGDRALEAGWFALAEIAVSLGPGMYVVDEHRSSDHHAATNGRHRGVRGDAGLLLVHELIPGPHRAERAIGR
jgi:hypothetical protein